MRKFWGSLVCIAALMLFLSVALLPTNNDAIAAASTNMPGAAQSAPTTQTVLVAQSALLTTVAKRLEQLNNVTVTFIEDDDYTPFDVPQADAAMKILVAKYHLHLGPVIRGHRIFDCLFSYLDGRARYENTMTPWTIAKLAATIGESFIGDFKTIQTFAPECVENLHYEPNVKFPLGSIQAEAPLPWSTIDVALGLRVSGTSVSWLRPEDIMRMIVKQEMNGDFTLQQVVGTYKYLWTFQRNPNLELVAFNASYEGVAFLGIDCTDFSNVNGVWLPQQIKETDWPSGGGGHSSKTVLITNATYTIGAKSNTPVSYFIVWPLHSIVLDERINRTFKIQTGN